MVHIVLDVVEAVRSTLWSTRFHWAADISQEPLKLVSWSRLLITSDKSVTQSDFIPSFIRSWFIFPLLSVTNVAQVESLHISLQCKKVDSQFLFSIQHVFFCLFISVWLSCFWSFFHSHPDLFWRFVPYPYTMLVPFSLGYIYGVYWIVMVTCCRLNSFSMYSFCFLCKKSAAPFVALASGLSNKITLHCELWAC